MKKINLLIITSSTVLLILSLLFGCSSKRLESTLPDTHPKAWADPSSSDFHGTALIANSEILFSCAECHGENFDGGKVDVSCIDCHLASGACTNCHGGVDNNTGAPPKGLRGETNKTSLAVGAHTVHLEDSDIAAGYACQTCHIVPSMSTDTSHFDLDNPSPPDSIAEVTWGGIVSGSDAVWDRNSATCADIYCHGQFVGGDTANNPVWNGADQALCGSCHDTGDNPADLLNNHEFHINLVGLNCEDCHASVVDDQLNIIGLNLHVNGIIDTLIPDRTICNNCHDAGAGSCVSCHGGLDNQTGAPPYGLRDEVTTDLSAVGAHTAHMSDGTFADAFVCDACHILPQTVSDPSHLELDSIAEITWGDISGNNGHWNRTSTTCSNTYCHGNFTGGNPFNIPDWTAQNQALCGSCHDDGSDPQKLMWKHNFHVSNAGLECRDCHSTVVDINRSIIDIALHVNGVADTVIADQLVCDGCHGANEGSCVTCHGGTDNQTGAPPQGIEGELLTTELAVGAHTTHIEGGVFSEAVECRSCHIVPLDWTEPTHIGPDFIAEVTWDGISGQSGVWDRNNADCSDTYCHGNFTGGNQSNAPIWTSSGQALCGSCHDDGSDTSKLSGRHFKHVFEEGFGCFECHNNVVDNSLNFINKGLHINGTNNVNFNRAPSGNFLLGSCSNVGVSGCHDDNGSETW